MLNHSEPPFSNVGAVLKKGRIVGRVEFIQNPQKKAVAFGVFSEGALRQVPTTTSAWAVLRDYPAAYCLQKRGLRRAVVSSLHRLAVASPAADGTTPVAHKLPTTACPRPPQPLRVSVHCQFHTLLSSIRSSLCRRHDRRERAQRDRHGDVSRAPGQLAEGAWRHVPGRVAHVAQPAAQLLVLGRVPRTDATRARRRQDRRARARRVHL